MKYWRGYLVAAFFAIVTVAVTQFAAAQLRRLKLQAAAARLLTDAANWRSRWRELVIFLAFCEYYLFLPGAITAPRYQLPALPLLCTLAGCMISAYVENRRAAEN